MTESYGRFPGVNVEKPSGHTEPEHRYVHIDEFESHDDSGVELHLYAFEEDDRRDECIDTIQDLRQDFIFATGIIWPDEIRNEVEQADTQRMRALEWAYAVSGHMDIGPDDLPEVADDAEKYIENE